MDVELLSGILYDTLHLDYAVADATEVVERIVATLEEDDAFFGDREFFQGELEKVLKGEGLVDAEEIAELITEQLDDNGQFDFEEDEDIEDL